MSVKPFWAMYTYKTEEVGSG